MKAANLPENEPERLSSLYSLNILDTDIEEEFDRFTRLAMNIFDVPIALISLVDEDRQWFKSCQGLSAQETDRDISFCGHAILQRGTFIVEDTLEDERFCDNPLVTSEPKIRFYAGQPIIYNDHYHLGTLCLIDHKPRKFTERDSLVLQDLTRLVQDEIESRELAIRDELTGLTNRRGFAVKAEQLIKLAKRRDMPLTLIYLDLDKFKLINDNFGHHEGDWVLQKFARALSQSCRESDVCARLAGDEFVLLLCNYTQEAVETVLNRLGTEVEKINDTIELNYAIYFSYGTEQYDAKNILTLMIYYMMLTAKCTTINVVKKSELNAFLA